MKKTLLAFLVSFAALALAGCGNNAGTQTSASSSSSSSSVSSSAAFSSETGTVPVAKGTVASNSTNLSQEDVEQITSLYEELQQALIDKDMDKLNELLPDDYTAIHITGRRQTKEEWLADIANGEMNYYEFIDMRYDLANDGDEVVMTVSQRIRARIYGSEGTWSIPGERRFAQVDGQWRIVG